MSINIESKTGSEGVDSVSVRLPMQVHISATDNAALYSVITRVYADTTLIQRDTAVIAGKSYDKILNINLSGVRSGQEITVLTSVSDGAGNAASGQATAVAFDPNVPQLAFVQPAATVIVGGTYSFDLCLSDSTGVAKAGYNAVGPGINRADSTSSPSHSRRRTRSPSRSPCREACRSGRRSPSRRSPKTAMGSVPRARC